MVINPEFEYLTTSNVKVYVPIFVHNQIKNGRIYQTNHGYLCSVGFTGKIINKREVCNG